MTHGEDVTDPIGMHQCDTIFTSLLFTGITERERQFLSSLRSDWLDDVMIADNSPGTCEWVLHSPIFQKWLSGSEKILWVQGNAGAGKTVLAKFLYRQLCEVFASDAVSSGGHRPQWYTSLSKPHSRPRRVLAYFLDVNSPLRNSGLSVLHSLLYQILSTDRELFRYLYGKPIFSQPQQGNFGQYAEVLSATLRDPSLRETIIVLDALDECGLQSQLKIKDLLETLTEQSSIQLLVTSRPSTILKPRFLLDLSESMEHVKLDIKIYVETAVEQLAYVQKLPEDLRRAITRDILAYSSGGFLWVQLVLQSISKARTVRMVRARLGHLPQDLRGAYSDALNGTTGSTDVNIRRALYFVMIAEVPLQIRELSALLAISHCWDHLYTSVEEMVKKQPSANDIGIARLAGMEEITENQTINFEQDFKNHFQPLLSLNETSVSLVHYSLQEFLETPSEIGRFQASFPLQPFEDRYKGDLRDVHGTMAALCLQYVLAALQKNDDPLDFLAFACIHWTEHARKAEESQSCLLEGLVELLFSENMDYASSWLRTVAVSQAARVTLLPLKADIAFVLAAFDLGSHFGKMLGVSVESLLSTDEENRTPLHLAAANNSFMSIQWIQNLLSTESRNLGDLATWKDFKGESPISLAAQNGHAETMELLLASINSRYDFDRRLFQTIAASGNKEMFENLYDFTKIENADQGMSLLANAVALDSVGLLKRISSDHGEPETTQKPVAALCDLNGDPLLHVALRNQASRVLNFLLDGHKPPAVTDRYRNTALHIAVREGSEHLALKLIRIGVPVNSVNKGGETPLHIASKLGLPAIVRLLCEFGANVNLAESSGCLPVHCAAKIGQEELINILLEFGTNANAADKIGRSALHVAAGAGQASTTAALLWKGADVNARDDDGRTPVHYAVESGDLNLLYILSEAGAEISASDDTKKSPLHLAAEHGSEILVRELIRLGTYPEARDSDYRTPLHYTCLSKRSTVASMRILLAAGADVSVRDRKRITPMHLAAEQGLDTIIQELANHGAELDCQDVNGMTPLHYAKQKSNIEITRLLHRLGAMSPAENKWNSLTDDRDRALESIGFGALGADEVEREKRLSDGIL